jgi:predicted PurR-regulated permease PerM
MSEKVYYAINHGSDVMQGLHQMDDFIFRKTGQKILSDDTLKKIQETLASIIPQLLGATASILADIGMLYFILYYLLINIGSTEKTLQEFLPVSDENAQRFADELGSMVSSNVMGAPLLAILQGFCAGLGFWIFGLDEPWFWGVICGFMSFLPVVGTAMVWIPAGIYMITAKTNWQGSGILIYGAVVITNIDNVFRFWLQKKFADVHPLVTVLGVIIGLNWFGIPGIVFGPLALSYFLLMVKMYKEEYGEKKLFRSSDSPE